MIEAINNLLLLQVAHIPDGSFRTELESGRSRPAGASENVTSVRLLTG